MNFYYTTTDGSLLTGMSTKEYNKEIITISAPAVLNDSPLSDDWDPANQSYGVYTIVPEDESISAPTISVGAQRPDMVAVPNSSSYRYPATDLGSF